MQPPGKYDALRQAEQQAKETRDVTPQTEAAAQPDSAQEEPTRPTRHAATFAQYSDIGEPVVPQTLNTDWAKQIAEEAKERADAAAQAREQDRGKDGQGR